MTQVEVRKLWRSCWLDPAAGETQSKHRKSRAAIVAIGQDNFERVFILDVWADRVAPDKLMDLVFDYNRRWRPAVFGIDASGPQKMFSQQLRHEAGVRGERLPLRELALHTDKDFSIETTIQPLAAAGRLFRPPIERCHKLKAEWDNFPGGFYKDILDALSCAIRLLPRTLPAHIREMGREQLRRYLHTTGMTREQIDVQLLGHQAQS